MLGGYEQLLLEQAQTKHYACLDALQRSGGDLNASGVDRDQLSYAWTQLCKAENAFKKLKEKILELRQRALARRSAESIDETATPTTKKGE